MYYDSLLNLNSQNQYLNIITLVSYLFSEYLNQAKTAFTLLNNNSKVNNMELSEEDATNKLSTSLGSSYLDTNFEKPFLDNQQYNSGHINSSKNNLLNKDKIQQLPNSNWEFIIKDMPQQTNTDDCGVFMCKVIDYISRNKEINFKQEDINFYRIQIGVELIKGELLN
jgi:hypothetical protein